MVSLLGTVLHFHDMDYWWILACEEKIKKGLETIGIS